MKKLNYLLVIIIVLIISCSDENDEINSNNIDESYYPLSLGSWWKYNRYYDGEFGNITKETVISDSAISGIQIHVIERVNLDDGSTRGLAFAPSDGKIMYYDVYSEKVYNNDGEFSENGEGEGEIFYYDIVLKIRSNETVVFADFNAAVGDTFSSFYNSKIIDKTAEVKIDGKVYSDVIVIERMESATAENNVGLLHWLEYYAKGVGKIKQAWWRSDGNHLTTFELIDYQIK